MDNKKICDMFNKFFKDSDSSKSLLVLLLIIGLCLIFFSSFFSSSSKEDTKKNSEDISAKEYKESLEKSIEDTLKDVSGVGDVSVTITLDGEVEKNIAYNENNSSSTSSNDNTTSSDNNTSSKDAVMVREGSSETPFTTKDTYPDVVGVVVVAQGANDKTVEYYITKSVEALLDLPSYKVVVLPSNNK